MTMGVKVRFDFPAGSLNVPEKSPSGIFLPHPQITHLKFPEYVVQNDPPSLT